MPLVAHLDERCNGSKLMSHKIDDLAVAGLAGVEDSLAYKVHETETHLHSRGRFWGALADPDETNAIDANVNRPFVAVSGDNTWGAAVPLCGTADDPTVGLAKFDAHLILVVDSEHTTPYRLRFIYGTGTSAAAIAAGQWSETMFMATAGPFNSGIPAEMQMPRVDVGSKLWAQVWSATNLSEVDFSWACHGYIG